jgi:hypothetical protein
MTLACAARPWPFVPDAVWWAVQAFRRETLGFRFHYPLEEVPEAGPKGSLHYYVYSDRLFFDAMHLDAHGIPVHRSRTFETYNPAYVAWYGLVNLERSLRHPDASGRATFLKQAVWLERHAVRRADDAVVWEYGFDWREGACVLKAPWISALAQGLAISALVRAYRITGEERLLDLGRGAAEVFEQDVSGGGVRTLEEGRVLYEEYPGYPPPRVLDGFLFGLLGLYDLFAQTGDARVFQLFAEGVDGLRATLPFWDYRGKWSWYGARVYLSPPHYNGLNRALLNSLGRVSGVQELRRCAAQWDPSRLTMLGRAEVFLWFLATKNGSRFRQLWRRG